MFAKSLDLDAAALAPAPKISATVLALPLAALRIAKAPMVAPRTKCVAPAHCPFKSFLEAVAQVVFFLPTITMAISSAWLCPSSPPILAKMPSPAPGRFAFTSSAVSSRTTCSLVFTPMKPYSPSM